MIPTPAPFFDGTQGRNVGVAYARDIKLLDTEARSGAHADAPFAANGNIQAGDDNLLDVLRRFNAFVAQVGPGGNPVTVAFDGNLTGNLSQTGHTITLRRGENTRGEARITVTAGKADGSAGELIWNNVSQRWQANDIDGIGTILTRNSPASEYPTAISNRWLPSSIGTNGQVLTSDGTNAAWQTPATTTAPDLTGYVQNTSPRLLPSRVGSNGQVIKVVSGAPAYANLDYTEITNAPPEYQLPSFLDALSRDGQVSQTTTGSFSNNNIDQDTAASVIYTASSLTATNAIPSSTRTISLDGYSTLQPEAISALNNIVGFRGRTTISGTAGQTNPFQVIKFGVYLDRMNANADHILWGLPVRSSGLGSGEALMYLRRTGNNIRLRQRTRRNGVVASIQDMQLWDGAEGEQNFQIGDYLQIVVELEKEAFTSVEGSTNLVAKTGVSVFRNGRKLRSISFAENPQNVIDPRNSSNNVSYTAGFGELVSRFDFREVFFDGGDRSGNNRFPVIRPETFQWEGLTTANVAHTLLRYDGVETRSALLTTGTSFLVGFYGTRQTDALVWHPDVINEGDLTVQGDLNIHGSTITRDAQQLNIGDNIITLNSGETGTPTENAGIEVERGTATNTGIRWNENIDMWELTNDGSAWRPISTVTGDSSDFRSSVSSFTRGILTLRSGTTTAGDGLFRVWQGGQGRQPPGLFYDRSEDDWFFQRQVNTTLVNDRIFHANTPLTNFPTGLQRTSTSLTTLLGLASNANQGKVIGISTSGAFEVTDKSAPGGGVVVADGSITTPKLADLAVTNAKLAGNAVQYRHMAPGSVGEDGMWPGYQWTLNRLGKLTNIIDDAATVSAFQQTSVATGLDATLDHTDLLLSAIPNSSAPVKFYWNDIILETTGAAIHGLTPSVAGTIAANLNTNQRLVFEQGANQAGVYQELIIARDTNSILSAAHADVEFAGPVAMIVSTGDRYSLKTLADTSITGLQPVLTNVIKQTGASASQVYSPLVTAQRFVFSGTAVNTGVALSTSTTELNLYESTSNTSITNTTPLGTFNLNEVRSQPSTYVAGGDIYTRQEAIDDGESPNVANAISITSGGNTYYLIKGPSNRLYAHKVGTGNVYFVIETPSTLSTTLRVIPSNDSPTTASPPVDGDYFWFADNSDSGKIKRVTFENGRSALQQFDPTDTALTTVNTTDRIPIFNGSSSDAPGTVTFETFKTALAIPAGGGSITLPSTNQNRTNTADVTVAAGWVGNINTFTTGPVDGFTVTMPDSIGSNGDFIIFRNTDYSYKIIVSSRTGTPIFGVLLQNGEIVLQKLGGQWKLFSSANAASAPGIPFTAVNSNTQTTDITLDMNGSIIGGQTARTQPANSGPRRKIFELPDDAPNGWWCRVVKDQDDNEDVRVQTENMQNYVGQDTSAPYSGIVQRSGNVSYVDLEYAGDMCEFIRLNQYVAGSNQNQSFWLVIPINMGSFNVDTFGGTAGQYLTRPSTAGQKAVWADGPRGQITTRITGTLTGTTQNASSGYLNSIVSVDAQATGRTLIFLPGIGEDGDRSIVQNRGDENFNVRCSAPDGSTEDEYTVVADANNRNNSLSFQKASGRWYKA